MPCPSGNTGPSIQNYPWSNWSGRIRQVLDTYVLPTSLGDLVTVARNASESGVRLKAIGSGWSFEDIAISDDWVVDIQALNRRLLDVITTETVNSDGEAILSHLVHVEAGIRILDLNELLEEAGLAMPSLGGSGGQTLAGAISTSTHGSDFDLPPLPDAVRAIHLVGEGGQEYWIEPRTGSITGRDVGGGLEPNQTLRDALPCADTIFRYDDELFKSVLVSVGRFGVVHAYVLEVRDSYRLREKTDRMRWATVRRLLNQELFGGGNDLVQPLRDRPPGPSEGAPQRFLQILLTPHINDNEECSVTRRWEIGNTGADAENIGLNASSQPTAILCTYGDANALLVPIIGALGVLIGATMAIPIVGWLVALPLIVLQVTLTGLLAARMTLGQLAATIINAVSRAGQAQLIRGLIQEIFNGALASVRQGPSHVVMVGTQVDQNASECYRAESFEAVFPESQKSYVAFIEDLRLMAVGRLARNRPVGGYISVRFSSDSRALLSMHHMPGEHAVSIEVANLSGLLENDEWMLNAEAAARRRDGIPHWGQRNTLTAAQVEQDYGDRLGTWRAQLQSVVGQSMTFSNDYTRQRALEPPGVDLEIPPEATCQEVVQITLGGCARWEDQGYFECAVEEDQGYNQCAAQEDRGYNRCAEQRDFGYQRCCTWWPCSWFCRAFVWILNVICVAWTWVSNLVCVAWTWVSNLVCVAWTWVSTLVCVAWQWTTYIVCLIFSPRRRRTYQEQNRATSRN